MGKSQNSRSKRTGSISPREPGRLSQGPYASKRQKHGWNGTPTHNVWRSMMRRCYARSKHNYQKNGIRVCKRWHTFINFIADMGPKPEGKTLDRKDSKRHYGPSNCRWATTLEQAQNTSRVIRIKIDREQIVLHHAIPLLGISQPAFHAMMRRHSWTHQQTVDHYLRSK